MKIAVDAMGGDFAPQNIVSGAVLASEEYGQEIILVGDQERIELELKKHHLKNASIEIFHCSQVVEMGESVTHALRKKTGSSIHQAAKLVKDGKASAIVTAGNTAAAVAVSMLTLGVLKGVLRPALALVIPTPKKGPSVILDVGATVDCKPIQLVQFGIMGQYYASEVLGIKKPRVGLLSIGEEENKGNEVTREAFKLMKDADNLNFEGNVEGRQIFDGSVSVIVCDGFIGNLVLKASESIAETMLRFLKQEFKRNVGRRIAAMLAKPALKILFRRLNWSEYGGAPLLGLNGIVIIGHGRSNQNAVKNAIRVARESYENRVNERIQKNLSVAANSPKVRQAGV
ncbi:phosphate acyltransferase PlsX [Acidobacteriota bacterium]